MSRFIAAIEIDGAGGDPGAWRGPEVDPRAILTGELAVRAAQRAEAAGVDLVTFADALEAPADVPDRVSVRLDALGLAARVAPVTQRIGLLPTITVTHTEPFHVQASVATLDHISGGRAGWIADVSTSAEAAAVIGRREPAPAAETWREARYVVDAGRRLWDSWEDDAIIRDAATGRFVDREKLHYVDFASPTFSVKGPSIVPRPPQGHPITAIRVTVPEALEAAADAELVFLPDSGELSVQVRALRSGSESAADRRSVTLTAGDGRRSVGLTPDRDPRGPIVLVSVEVRPHADGVGRLLESVERWVEAGVDGVQLRPASLELDVPVIAEQLLPVLRERGLVGSGERGGSLRGRLGLRRPVNRYARSTR
ncbi:LLM class flavin-dependent oxidoreductase [Kribbella speibonae]|uniref:LLM class flavin-dependent oxidoreductase n=1 Tax=Kribbella speibonae TaxID=1572660 RepID=A0ABY2A1G8_9ACTN|nr:LLM class flavin-dependent oxidoreductase [Kribbella speibonae]TCC20135.1 LLM class flavin-dependent oxidoreductase [Kribbella speibonae]